MVGKEIGHVPLKRFSLSVYVEGGIHIHTLTWETNPVIESFAGLVVLVPHVPFTYVSGAIAGFLQVFGKKPGGRGNGALIVHDVVVAHVLPREDGSSTGRAKGGGNESICKVSAFAGEAIEARGFEELRSFLHEAQEIVAMIVAENQNDVLLFSKSDRGEKEQQRQDRKGY